MRIRVGLAMLMAGSTPVMVRADDLAERAVAVIEARCSSCHGPEKQKAGLRLDGRAGALAGGDSGPAIVPGDVVASLLLEVIGYEGPIQMPPKSKLPDGEIELLKRWVEAGAEWGGGGAELAETAVERPAFDLAERARHWSFQPMADVEPPAVEDRAWPRGPIDRFVLARLEAEGLRPAAEAERAVWLRRVTFDLTGLPPSPSEIAAFEGDRGPDAFDRVVARLLASPRNGERWGRHWLDLVRYAETAGHEFDYDIPNAWRYRDYVVRAINADLPYDRFVVEQIAGDLLEEPRRNPLDGSNESILGTGFYWLGEGTHSPVDLLEDRAARMDNQIDVMGKAFLGLTIACARCHDHKFDAIGTRDYYAMVGYLRSSRHQQGFLDDPSRLAPILSRLDAIRAEVGRAIGVEHPDSAVTAESFASFDRDFEGWTATGPAFGDGPTGPREVRVDEVGASALPAGWAHSGRVDRRLAGVLRSPTFTIERPFVQILASGKGGRINLVVDGFEKIRAPIYGGLTLDVDQGDSPRWSVIDATMWKGHRAYLELADGGVVDFRQSQARVNPGDGWLAVGEVRFSASATAPDAVGIGSVALALDDCGPGVSALLDEYRGLAATIAAPTLALAMLDGTPDDSAVHVRGSTKNLGPVVPRGFLEALGGVGGESTAGSGRLELARRIVDPSNPLSARVIVNRVWQHHFGSGLVATPDDFGKMGQPPSHPELLDWLARDFMAGGWSLKRLHRAIVLSRTYRQASQGDGSAESADPNNRLLHRANLRRLDAEALRDAILAVSGGMAERVGGPSIPPFLSEFQEGRGRPGASGPLDGDGRRSIYLNIRRNFLPSFLLAFDFPSPATCMGRRNVSNVPAQALTLLNDPFVVEQAKRAGADVRRGRSDEEAVGELWLRALGRRPRGDELDRVRSFLIGRDPDAAWSELAHVVFNAKEFAFVP